MTEKEFFFQPFGLQNSASQGCQHRSIFFKVVLVRVKYVSRLQAEKVLEELVIMSIYGYYDSPAGFCGLAEHGKCLA